MTPEFKPFPKTPRMNREVILTEKIDGTNASVYIYETGETPPEKAIVSWKTDGQCFAMFAGSRTRWITPGDDNSGFAAWVRDKADQLRELGPGHHFGEWWGSGIQRGYGLVKGEKRFSLFNTIRWALHGTEPQVIPTADPRIVKMQDVLPPCCGLVPVLYRGVFDTKIVKDITWKLRVEGSKAAPGFKQPEGVVVFHIAGNTGFKVTIDNDDEPKGKS